MEETTTKLFEGNLEDAHTALSYDWEGLIAGIIEGIKKFLDMIQRYLPTVKHGWDAYKVEE